MKIKKVAACFLTLCLSASPSFASNDVREADRVKESGEVMKEILNIPDDIPQDLLDKAECIVVLPSVKKGAFGVGGSYGRGVMICRGGEHYTGPWLCTRSKASASDSSSAARPPILSCW